MIVLSTIYFWLVFLLTAPLVLVVGTVVFLVSLPFDPQRRVIHTFICAVVFNYLRVNPLWRVRVEGREKIPTGASVIVVNHQSMADVISVMGLRGQFKFVSKASLFELPIVGWMMRMAKYVSLHRGRHSSMQQMMSDCRGWLRGGMAVLIFPEGTYSTDGRMLPFRRGAFQLAISEQVPVVPVVLHGTRELVIEDGPWMSPRANVRIEVLEPIPVSELGTDDDALTERVRELMRAAAGSA